MRDPFGWLPVLRRGRSFAILAGLAVILMALLNVLGVPLRTEISPAGIVSYELAGSLRAAEAILNAWGGEGRVYAGVNLGLDYLFLVAYGAAIALGCTIVAGRLRDASRGVGALGAWLAWAALGAATLDSVENYALIRLLLGSASAALPAVARACAIVKFFLVALSLLYVFLGALASVALRGRKGHAQG